MAYAKMQFVHMADEERAFYYHALLIIVNRDTLAMVLIYEGWKDDLIDQIGWVYFFGSERGADGWILFTVFAN